MSIINDAIKKARKVYTVNMPKEPASVVDAGEIDYSKIAAKGPRKPALQHRLQNGIIISLVFLIAFLVAVILYKQASRVNMVYVPVAPVANIETSSIPAFIEPAPLKNPSSITKFEDALELEGIVYDDAASEKWAIINNNIFKEGDPIMDGKVTLIMKDYVKIERNSKGAVTLNLKR